MLAVLFGIKCKKKAREAKQCQKSASTIGKSPVDPFKIFLVLFFPWIGCHFSGLGLNRVSIFVCFILKQGLGLRPLAAHTYPKLMGVSPQVLETTVVSRGSVVTKIILPIASSTFRMSFNQIYYLCWVILLGVELMSRLGDLARIQT